MIDSEQLFSYNDFWHERSLIEESEFTTETVEFLFLKLSSSMVKELISKETVKEKLHYAANNGMSFERERIIDNENLKKDLELFWLRAQSKYPPTPSLQMQAGQHVCDISGLSAHIKETQALEDEMTREEDETEAYEANKIIDANSVLEVSADSLSNDAQHELTNAA
jgi:hypothetical protein